MTAIAPQTPHPLLASRQALGQCLQRLLQWHQPGRRTQAEAKRIRRIGADGKHLCRRAFDGSGVGNAGQADLAIRGRQPKVRRSGPATLGPSSLRAIFQRRFDLATLPGQPTQRRAVLDPLTCQAQAQRRAPSRWPALPDRCAPAMTRAWQ